MHKYYEDRLVRRFRNPQGRWLAPVFHGKRVGKDCPLTREEVRMYVEHGAIWAVKLIKESRQISLREAKDLLDKARGQQQRFYEVSQ